MEYTRRAIAEGMLLLYVKLVMDHSACTKQVGGYLHQSIDPIVTLDFLYWQIVFESIYLRFDEAFEMAIKSNILYN